MTHSFRRMAARVGSVIRRGTRVSFEGDYDQWEDALRASDGYDATEILDRVRASARRVREEPGWFERDGVLFARVEWNFGLIAGLLRIANACGHRLRVLDIGGSLGSTYHHCRPFLDGLAGLRWMIVEQPHFVDCGRNEFQTDELRFHYDVAAALHECPADVALLSGVLPYLPDPYGVLDTVADAAVPWLIVDRTPTRTGDRDRLVIERVPPAIYGTALSYPAHIFSGTKLRGAIAARWPIVVDARAIDGIMPLVGGDVDFRLLVAGPAATKL